MASRHNYTYMIKDAKPDDVLVFINIDIPFFPLATFLIGATVVFAPAFLLFVVYTTHRKITVQMQTVSKESCKFQKNITSLLFVQVRTSSFDSLLKFR